MPSNPTPGDRHVSAALTDLSVAYSQSNDMFVADKVFPNITVTKSINKYFIHNKSDSFRHNMEKRAPGEPSKGMQRRLSTDSYETEKRSVHIAITDEERAEADPVFDDLDREAMQDVTKQDLLDREINWATDFFAASKWGTTDFTPGNLWDTAAGDPINDIDTKVVEMAMATGYVANTLVMIPEVFIAVKENSKILDKIKHTQTGVVTTDLLASLFFPKGGRVFVAWGVNTTTNPGQATQTVASIFGKHALLMYVNPMPGKKRASAGYTFVNRGVRGVAANGSRIKNIRVDEKDCDKIEIDSYWDQKIVASDLGQLFLSVVS
jgi:hypothetical protein